MSTTTASPPSRRTACAISTPTGPPPRISRRRGTAFMPVASRLVQTPSSSRRPGTGGTTGSAPFARTTWSAVWRTPSTSTTPGPASRPVPRSRSMPLVGQPALLPGVGVVGDHEVAPGERRLDVDLGGRRPPRARRGPPRPAAAASSTGCRPSTSTRRRRARAPRRRRAGRPRPARPRSARPATRRRARSRRSRCPWRSAAREAGPDLLQQPAVAVRIAERGERAVVGVFRQPPPDARLAPGVMEYPGRVVERRRDLDPARGELGAGGVEVVDRELQALAEPGSAPVTPSPKMIEQPEPGGVSCTTR